MIPVDQTVLGASDSNNLGNCLYAAAASILEVPLDRFPPFTRDGKQWWDQFLDAIRPFGYTAIQYSNGQDGYPAIEPKGYHIASGISPRGFYHATVALDGKMVHDPHPDRTGIDRIRRFYLMLPLAPDTPTTLELAKRAVQAVAARRDENIDEWANRLADDVKDATD